MKPEVVNKKEKKLVALWATRGMLAPVGKHTVTANLNMAAMVASCLVEVVLL